MSLTEKVEDGVQESVDGEDIPVARPDNVAPVIDEWHPVVGQYVIEDGRTKMSAREESYLSLGTSVPGLADPLPDVVGPDDPRIAELYLRADGEDELEGTARLTADQARGLFMALRNLLKIHGELPANNGGNNDA